MPTPESLPHHARGLAASFGGDAERYGRTRPRYPQSLVRALLSEARGRCVLDVGIGTGVSARPFRAAGRRVLGVEPDARMAAFARADGFEVEVARFERWGAAGRRFDLLISGTAWHWIDPAAGAAKAARVLRPGGVLAVFWNLPQPPAELAEAFSVVYARELAGTPLADMPRDALAAYEPILARTCDGVRAAAGLTEPRRRRVDWTRRYTTAQWLEQVPTFGGHGRLPDAQLRRLLNGIGASIDAVGGAFTARYATLAITATRCPAARG